jgi:arylsulfate sulfotransferase
MRYVRLPASLLLDSTVIPPFKRPGYEAAHAVGLPRGRRHDLLERGAAPHHRGGVRSSMTFPDTDLSHSPQPRQGGYSPVRSKRRHLELLRLASNNGEGACGPKLARLSVLSPMRIHSDRTAVNVWTGVALHPTAYRTVWQGLANADSYIEVQVTSEMSYSPCHRLRTRDEATRACSEPTSTRSVRRSTVRMARCSSSSRNLRLGTGVLGPLLLCAVLGATVVPLAAQLAVTLEPSLISPAPLGSVITWQARVSGANGARLWYRYRERSPGSHFRVVRDYGPLAVLDSTAIDREGSYTVQVSVRNLDTGEVADVAADFTFDSRVTAGEPVISATSHPLVFLYSAPSCRSGDRMRVQFTGPSGGVQNTQWKACTGATTMNFYLAGLRAQAQYAARHTFKSGAATLQTFPVAFTTGESMTRLAMQTVLERMAGNPDYPILLQGTLMAPVVATDLEGNVVWYYAHDISQFTRFDEGGLFWGIDQSPAMDKTVQVVRQWDLVGMAVRETNAARLNEQVVAMGAHEIGALHHEAIRLPDGNIAVLATVEEIMTDVQGPGTYTVLGDMIIVMNDDMQVIWTWNTFDHLDVHRKAVLGQTCAAGGCPTLFSAPDANDWVHGNSITYTPDNNLLYSMRHQDWLVKIDYSDGSGSGDIIWRLGKDGDFRFLSDDPWPWFSHQHDAEFDTRNHSILSVFDNGNTRFEVDKNTHSRGQIIQIDEASRTATLLVNADLGAYSFALGSAQPLSRGTYHFGVGWVLQNAYSRGVEIDESGGTVFALQTATPVYRSVRLRDMYSAK